MSASPSLFRLVEVSRLSGGCLRRSPGGWHPSLDLIRTTARALHRSPTTLRLYIEDVRGKIVEQLG